MAPGVGKTYAMLEEAHLRFSEGVRLLVGVIKTHGRQETEKLLEGLPILPEKPIEYKGKVFTELDLDGILEAAPQLVLIDELAHTNIPGSKHPKRWQDVVDILDAGINVYTTLNVQHLESRKDLVEGIAGIQVHETVPDLILERASEVEIIDLPPTELLKRLKEGKVYLGDQSVTAAQNFFQEGHLMALREIALRLTAEKVDHDLHGILAFGKGWKTRERLMVAISPAHSSQQLIRAARRMAFELDAPWVAAYVHTGESLSPETQARVNKHLQLARELGAEVMSVEDVDVANALQRIAKQKNITRLVLERPSEPRWFRSGLGHSLVDRLVRENSQMDILILRQDKLTSVYKQTIPSFQFSSTALTYGMAVMTVILATLIAFPLSSVIGYKVVGFLFLVVILILGLFLGSGPTMLAALLSALSWDVLFIPPLFMYRLSDSEDFALMVIYFFAAGIVGVLANRIRAQDLLIRRREKNIARLYDIMREMAKATDLDDIKMSVEAKLKGIFNADFDVFVRKDLHTLALEGQSTEVYQETDRAAALWCLRSGRMAGWSTDTLPSAQALYVPIIGVQGVVGVLMYRPKDQKPLSIDDLHLLQNVAEQLSIYLERFLGTHRAPDLPLQ